jgi:hypothetical protein
MKAARVRINANICARGLVSGPAERKKAMKSEDQPAKRK